MVIITNFTPEYNEEEKIYYYRADEVIPCPVCGGELGKRGWRLRRLKKLDGGLHLLKVQRFICKGCGKSHRGLPKFIVPYKQLELEAIEHVINRVPTKEENDDRTIRHIFTWWWAMIDYIERYMAAIKEGEGGVITILSPLTNLAEIARVLVNSHKWPCTHFALRHGP